MNPTLKLKATFYFAIISASLGAPALAAASANLTGELLEASVAPIEGGLTGISFKAAIRNSGDQTASGQLRIKPFLVAKDKERGAVVLPNLDTEIRLAPGAQTEVEYRQPLPLLESGDWYLSAVINPNWNISEEGPRAKFDNTPDLIRVGSFAVTRAAPIGDAEYDLYPRVVDTNTFEWGTISHNLRAIVRGRAGTFAFDSEDLRALFGVISFETGKVTLLDYNQSDDPEQPEKEWYAISWQSEKDADGNDIAVDYYFNNIIFSHIQPGKYRFFTLLNTHDLLPEANVFDNIETSNLDLTLAELPQNDVIYVATTAGTATEKPVSLRNLYSGSLSCTPSLSLRGVEMASSLSTLEVADRTDFRVQLPALSAGVYEGTLALNSELTTDSYYEPSYSYNERKQVAVKYWVFDGAAPVLQRSKSHIALSAHQGRDSDTETVVFSNTGGADLEFRIKSTKPWLVAQPNQGTIPPGGSITIEVKALSTANLGDRYHSGDAEGRLLIQANTLQAQEGEPIYVNLQTRNQ